MNAVAIDRTKLREAVAAAERRFPLRVLGLLPRGAAPRVTEPVALDLLAEGGDSLTLISLGAAEEMLSDVLGLPVAIVLKDELANRRDAGIMDELRPL